MSKCEQLEEITSIDKQETVTKSKNAVVLTVFNKIQIAVVIKMKSEPIRQCHVQRPENKSSIQDRIQIQLVIAQDGSVSKAKGKR